MVRFVFEAGLPYLGLRTAIRSDNSHIINDMYIYMIDIFCATKKRLYAKLCVFNLHSLHILKSQLRSIWERYRKPHFCEKKMEEMFAGILHLRMIFELSSCLGQT